MRPPSKHGLERRFKPWRKGKSSLEKNRKVGGGSGSATNTSLKNLLRGQKRLLSKLQKDKGDENAIDGARLRIAQLEKDISSYKAREHEKKNASKYHQVKFIERQKLTRLEKSVKRQLQHLQKQQQSSDIENEIAMLQKQVQSIAMDQLYIAFYPTNMKYMALFTNGTERIQYDERGEKRRMGVWMKIRQELLLEEGGDGDGGSDTKMRLNNAKKWANLDVAKKALLSMPEGTYPNNNALSAVTVNATPSSLSASAGKTKQKKDRMHSEASLDKKVRTNCDGPPTVGGTRVMKGKEAGTKESLSPPDSRFALSKHLDGLFDESTTGEDYQKEMTLEEKPRKEVSKNSNNESSSSASDGDGSSSEDDNADPLQGFDSKKKVGSLSPHGTTVSSAATSKLAASSSSSSSCPSSSSSSSDSSDSDSSESDSSESSDSNSDDPPSSEEKQHQPAVSNSNQTDNGIPKDEEGDDGSDSGDDFFTTEKLSAGDVFTQVGKDNEKKKTRSGGHRQHHFNDDDDAHYNQHRKPDKSRGFKSQNQSGRDYRAYQNQRKRHKFG
mmetsp:Transcript_31366/g.75806  ORF Transcript_31366/g.75806 Transcript_31366/m.75806 type:complete len:554 (-) Transcript_31366:124-1785(-)